MEGPRGGRRESVGEEGGGGGARNTEKGHREIGREWETVTPPSNRREDLIPAHCTIEIDGIQLTSL